MIDLLDWAVDLNQQQDCTKAEFALLAYLEGRQDHPNLFGLTFEDDFYQTLTSTFLPQTYTPVLTAGEVAEFYGDRYEADYLISKLSNTPQEDYNYSYSTDVELITTAHQVFFKANFTRNHTLDSTLKTKILERIDQNPFPYIVNYFQLCDWVGELLLCLRCMDQEIPLESLEFIEDLDEIIPTWSYYHCFLVKRILEII